MCADVPLAKTSNIIWEKSVLQRLLASNLLSECAAALCLIFPGSEVAHSQSANGAPIALTAYIFLDRPMIIKGSYSALQRDSAARYALLKSGFKAVISAGGQVDFRYLTVWANAVIRRDSDHDFSPSIHSRILCNGDAC
jgi:hypothetical protein